jgi:hypothetical protein
MKNDLRQEKLTRLFESTGPASIPTLEPDPHLPARIRALAREGATERSGARRGATALLWPRSAWLSLGAAAVALALLGGYIGYRAGTSLAASSFEVAEAESAALESADAFWSAWSQSGFAEELRAWNTENGEVD